MFSKFILLLMLAMSVLLMTACNSSASPTPNAPSATNPTAEPTADATKALNDLATSVAAVQNPQAASTATATRPAATSLPDPCTLATQTEVNAALGEQFPSGKSEQTLPGMYGADGTPRLCTYVKADKQVLVLIMQGTRPYPTQKGLTDFQKTLTPVAGLGDDAFWDSASSSLWALKGNLTLVIEFDRLPNASLEMAKGLMQKALSRAQ